MKLFVCAALLFVASCSTSKEIEVDRKHCEQLRDHMVDLRLATAGSGVDLKAHRAAMQQALGDRFVDSCEQLTSAELECSLHATDLATATACARPSK